MAVPVAVKLATVGDADEQNVCVADAVGAEGVAGCALITALPDAVDVQLPLFTVKV
jgi:hypothetical protein